MKGYTKETVLDAIKGSGGITSTIAKRLQCDYTTARRYIEKWESTKQAYENETETILDMAESVIYKAIRDEDVATAKWLLSTKGKDRGYGERHELQHSGDIQIDVSFE